MPVAQGGAQRAARHRLGRVIHLAVAALLVATAGSVAAPAPARAATTLRAVVIVGPVGGSTTRYLERGERIADAAEARGMSVTRIFHPRATWETVVRSAQGANLLVYLGHGNGWPSPYGSYQKLTKDGFGLNPYGGASAYTTKYYGEGPIAEHIRLAPNAVVLLNHLCYASGNGESGHGIPSQSVAIQRVDNFAAGFLRAGARGVFAYGHQYVTDVIAALFTTDKSLDAIFMTPSGTKGFNGSRDFWASSSGTAGKRLHLDPYPDLGYLRAVSGDLTMTAGEFRSGGAVSTSGTGDTAPPRLDGVRAVGAAHVFSSTASGGPIFTPNGDAQGDRLRLVYSGLSEDAYVDVRVRRPDGTLVRSFAVWSGRGTGTIIWNGKTDSGAIARDGAYAIRVAARDRAGNRSSWRTVGAGVMTTLESIAVTPRLFYARDGDALAPRTTLRVTLIRDAVVTWKIVDRDGNIVRERYSARASSRGTLGWHWYGRDATGAFVRDGVYYSVVSAKTAAGTYGQRTAFRTGAFRIGLSDPSPRRGQSVTFRVVSAEPLARAPSLTLRQPGVSAYTVSTRNVQGRIYEVTVTLRSGGTSGTLALVTSGIDSNGRRQSTAMAVPLQ